MELRVNKCCCMSLRTGGLVIGGLGLVVVILQCVMIIFSIEGFFPGIRVSNPYATIAFNLLIGAAINGSMIYGIEQNKHLMLLPWLIISALGLVVSAPVCIILMIMALTSADLAFIGLGLIAILFVGFGCWLWVVIFSLYKEIRESTKQPLTIYENSSLDNMPVPPYQELEKNSYGPANV